MAVQARSGMTMKKISADDVAFSSKRIMSLGAGEAGRDTAYVAVKENTNRSKAPNTRGQSCRRGKA